MVVVRAELNWVHSRVANIRIKPNTQDSIKCNMNAMCGLLLWIWSFITSCFVSDAVISPPVKIIINIVRYSTLPFVISNSTASPCMFVMANGCTAPWHYRWYTTGLSILYIYLYVQMRIQYHYYMSTLRSNMLFLDLQWNTPRSQPGVTSTLSCKTINRIYVELYKMRCFKLCLFTINSFAKLSNRLSLFIFYNIL